MSSQAETIWFITRTSRGIGLEITKQLLECSDASVLVACRSPEEASALKDIATFAGKHLHVLRLNVNEPQSIKGAAREAGEIVGEKGIDYLINNAGINPGGLDTAFTCTAEDLTAGFEINVVGPALVAKSGEKTIVNVSSTLGSIGTDCGQIAASYCVTKAALNMLTVKQAKERPDLTVMTMCPGHLQTDLGGPDAKLPVSVGVSGVLKVVRALTAEDNGAFFDFRGERVQW